MEEDCRYKENLDGYENKLRIEDTIALKEEKKEKKHKKEKKDREKREGKEKKDKDRDDGKDKEKRDKKEKHKKEKHRDKKKKDKDKDKEKGSNAETSGAAASASASVLGTKIDDKLGATKERGSGTIFASNEKNGFSVVSRRQNGDENIPVPRNNNHLISQGMEDSNFVLELARRINDDEKVTHQNQFLDKKEESRFVQELDRRFKDEEQVTTNQLDRFSAAAGKKKIDDGEYTLVKSPGDFVVDKKGKDRHIGFKTMDGKGIVKFGENSMVQTFTGTAKSSIGELPGTTQGKEKPKENDDKSRKKHKSKDGEKKSHSKKDKDVEKEKKKAKKKKQDKSDTEPLTQEGRRNGPDDVSINAGMTYPVVSKVMSSVPLSDDQRNNAIADGTEKRSKELDTNGPLNSCSAGRSYPVGFEVMGSFPLSDQRNNATDERTEKPRNEMDVNGPVNSSNASSFTEVMGSNSTPLSGQKNHAVVVRRNEKKKQKEINTNGPEIIRTATKNYSVGIPELMGSVPLSDFQNHPIVIGNAKKRNDIDIDGFCYDNEARTNKVPRLSPPLNSLENGRKLEAHQSVKVLTSEKHDGGSARSLQMDNNKEQQQQEQKKNGLIDAKSLHILGPNPAAVLSDQIIERPRKTKPPHPDTEFLSQILTVPKMDEWNGFDDQEWLLCGREPPPSRKPPEMCSAGVSEDLQVWSEALNIEPMDIVAFPYVLPY